MLTSETQTDGPLCLLTVISDPGKADAMARFALRNGALAAYHFYAHGTAPGHLLTLLGLSGVRREMICLTVAGNQGHALLDDLCRHFHIGREMNGIAFLQNMDPGDKGPAAPSDYVLLAAVVNEGEGEYLVESARRCQPVGATILRALGTADHSKKTFDFEIVPQKEVVLIVARSCYLDALYRAIYDEMVTESPGRGILFSLPLVHAAGLLDMVPSCEEPSGAPQQPSEPACQEDHVALFVAADRGHTAGILATVEACGGTGATILHCRLAAPGSGGWYSRLGDPEKEIVLVITQSEKAEQIRRRLADEAVAARPVQTGQLRVTRFRHLSELRDAR